MGRDIVVGCGMNLVSLVCSSVKYAFIIFYRICVVYWYSILLV